MAERNPKGSANVVRRTWDKNKYEQKAKDREEYGDEHVDKPAATDDEGIRDRQEFRAAEPGAAGPAGSKRAWLQPREKTYGFEQQAGHTQVLMNAEIQKKATGWYCDVCECLLRDSASYLDHVNGKKHQRKLGYSMRTQRVGVEQVRDRLATVTEERRRAEEEAKRRRGLDTNQEYERILEAREADEAAKREAKKDAKKRKREEAAAAAAAAEAEEDVDDEAAAMNAMMGFGSFFGGARKGPTRRRRGRGRAVWSRAPAAGAVASVTHVAAAARRVLVLHLGGLEPGRALRVREDELAVGPRLVGRRLAREPPQLLPINAALRPERPLRLVAAAFGGDDHGLLDVRRRGDLAEALGLVFGGGPCGRRGRCGPAWPLFV